MTNEEAIKVLEMVEAYGVADTAKRMAISALKNEQTDGDLISRQSVITMLQKIENAVEDGDGFQFNEWIYYAKDIQSAEKTAEWISVLEQIKEELSHISKPEIDKEDYENGVYDGVNLAIRTIDKYAGELVHIDISLIKKDILSELEKLENYPSKDNSVFARINTYKRCIGIIDKHIGELEQTSEWEYNSFGDKWRCTKCFQSNNEKTKYCPNCGARMKEGDTE